MLFFQSCGIVPTLHIFCNRHTNFDLNLRLNITACIYFHRYPINFCRLIFYFKQRFIYLFGFQFFFSLSFIFFFFLHYMVDLFMSCSCVLQFHHPQFLPIALKCFLHSSFFILFSFHTFLFIFLFIYFHIFASFFSFFSFFFSFCFFSIYNKSLCNKAPLLQIFFLCLFTFLPFFVYPLHLSFLPIDIPRCN